MSIVATVFRELQLTLAAGVTELLSLRVAKCVIP